MRLTRRLPHTFGCEVLVCVVLCPFAAAKGLTSKAIFAKYESAVVKVICPPNAALNFPGDMGTGFIVSSDGTVFTAGHVVEITEQGRVSPCQNLRVVLSDGRPLAAELLQSLSQETVEHDYAILKTGESVKHFIPLGSWTNVVEGDDLTIIGYPLNAPTPFLLKGSVAGRAAMPNPVTGNAVNAIYFQSPANVGLSGSPIISNKDGKVVGIVSSKLVGLSPGLATLLRKISTPQRAVISISGVNFVPTVRDLLQLLRERLISGMGGAVAIDYAKASLAAAPSGKK
jgi:hypothetical protein